MAAKRATDKAAPWCTSGAFKGWFRYDGSAKKHATRVDIVFAKGKVTGAGEDEDGAFTVRGTYDGRARTASWTKAYDVGAGVRYAGAWNESLRVIEGTWSIPRSKPKGTFALGRGKGKAVRPSAPAAPSAAVLRALRERPVRDEDPEDHCVTVHVKLSGEGFGSAGDLAFVKKLDKAILAALDEAGVGGPGDSGCGGGYHDLEYRGPSKKKLLGVIRAVFEGHDVPKDSFFS